MTVQSVAGADVGDLVSPGMFEDHLTSLNTAWAYHDSGEGYIFEFAVNLQTLNYLQTINLLDDDILHTTLDYMQSSKSINLCVCCFQYTSGEVTSQSSVVIIWSPFCA